MYLGFVVMCNYLGGQHTSQRPPGRVPTPTCLTHKQLHISLLSAASYMNLVCGC